MFAGFQRIEMEYTYVRKDTANYVRPMVMFARRCSSKKCGSLFGMTSIEDPTHIISLEGAREDVREIDEDNEDNDQI